MEAGVPLVNQGKEKAASAAPFNVRKFGCGGPIRTEYTIFEHTVSQRTDPFRRESLRTKAIAGVVCFSRKSQDQP